MKIKTLYIDDYCTRFVHRLIRNFNHNIFNDIITLNLIVNKYIIVSILYITVKLVEIKYKLHAFRMSIFFQTI